MQELMTCSDMQVFSPAEIKRAGELLHCQLDEASAVKALIIQRDTGLSLARGEISIVPFNGKPTVMINKQGYLAYAARQQNYNGYESGTATEDGETVAWCTVYNKDIEHPVKVKIYGKEYTKNTPIWREKPRYMLEKTAISLALRAAFPILNGTYEEGEIEPDSPVKITPKPTDIQVKPANVPHQQNNDTDLFCCVFDPSELHEQSRKSSQEKPVNSGIANASAIAENYAESCKNKPASSAQVPAAKCKIYVDIEAEKIKGIYADEGWDTSIFDHAKISDDRYNKDMIDDDYKSRIFDKYAKESAAKSKNGTISNAVIGGENGELQNVSPPAAVGSRPSEGVSDVVCEKCGKVLLKSEVSKSNTMFGGVMLCEQCAKKYLEEKIKAKNEGN